ncbi:MAG: hypothetical protein AVDCRST_MAG78-2284 [uncultured Rubrobacteraceae bacterium]|uniref:Metallo-beta-lactamase domain-containing protein n=1 Tax=uncultured Rubrobacteraceae bacterium TaxID=349277 RepID=A0A6J4QBF9_9ACTN|nr:MAG: hypothetical protein AVDCRST_MAG78-2284 [uncultured Rubrobacteraceae bacterium]
MKSIIVGEVEITALTDLEGPFFGLERVFPGVTADQWATYLRRYPWAFANDRTLHGRIGAYLLRSPDRTVLVDAGIGSLDFGIHGRLLEDLEENGVRTEEVDVVFLTHLHGDHLGWSLTAEGEPTFPRARYVAQAAEWEASYQRVERMLSPLESLGVLDLLDGEEPVTEEAMAIPTPGHSPGHASLLVSSGGEQAVVTGDVIVHPAQATEPTWNTRFDADKEQAAFTREMLLEWAEADGITLAAGHIPGSGFGRVVREEGRRYWRAIQGQERDALSRTEEEEIHGSRTE